MLQWERLDVRGGICLRMWDMSLYCIESSRAGGMSVGGTTASGSVVGRELDVTRGFPPMRRDFPGVREGQLVFFTVCIPRRLHQHLQPLFSGLPSYLIGWADKSIDRRPTCTF